MAVQERQPLDRNKIARMIRGLRSQLKPLPIDQIHGIALDNLRKDESIPAGHRGMLFSIVQRTNERSYLQGVRDGLMLASGGAIEDQEVVEANVEVGNMLADFREQRGQINAND